MLPPVEPFPFSATGLLVGGRGLFKGLSVRETTNAATARVDVLDGSAGGILLATFALAANESVRDWFGESGIRYESGLFVTVAAGAVTGSAWSIPENRFEGFSFPSEWAEGNQ